MIEFANYVTNLDGQLADAIFNNFNPAHILLPIRF